MADVKSTSHSSSSPEASSNNDGLVRSILRAILLALALIQLGLYLFATFVVFNVMMLIVRTIMLAIGQESALRNLQSFLLRMWISPFIHHVEIFGGLRFQVTGDAFREGESALVVCNHRAWTDTICMYSLARQVGGDGDVKFLAKKVLLFFPVLGFVGLTLDVVIFIKRQASKAEKTIQHLFKQLTSPQARKNFWMISYLEGTRLTAKKLEDAKAFAKKRDLHVLQHVLQPRVKGFTSSIHELYDHVDAVYDVTIGYEDGEDLRALPEFSFLCRSFCFGEPRTVHVHQKRIPIQKVPRDDEEAIHKFVYDLYYEKDQLLDHHKQHGTFPGNPVPWTPISTAFSLGSFTIFLLISILFTMGTWTLTSQLRTALRRIQPS